MKINAADQIGHLEEHGLLGFLELQFGNLLGRLAGPVIAPGAGIVQRKTDDHAVGIFRVAEAESIAQGRSAKVTFAPLPAVIADQVEARKNLVEAKLRSEEH